MLYKAPPNISELVLIDSIQDSFFGIPSRQVQVARTDIGHVVQLDQLRGRSQIDNSETKQENQELMDLQERLKTLRQTFSDTIKSNDTAPENEQLQRSELVIEFEMRQSILEQSEATIAAMKNRYQQQNLRNRVKWDRLKKECWDAMTIHSVELSTYAPKS